MKRNIKTFSVEIKKSRVQGQHHHLPPKRLFELTSIEPAKIVQKEEPQAAVEPAPAPRILQSIVESVWNSPEPVEPVRRKRSSVEIRREQMESDLTATAFEDAKTTHVGDQVSCGAVPQTDGALDDAEDPPPVHDVQAAQGEGVRAGSRKPRKKVPTVDEPKIACETMPEAELTIPSAAPSNAVPRRLTKRQAAAAQFPRHERWKGRLHPAVW
ncbi:hypothetical protein [Microvirga lotononidis]|uniref:Uncharacterized protein n=1 Tax=Microvirga lotononidis TaxID=864069 RepID=I4YKA3_9HYPH|nr:hypothetical protein [Microvirga lotononidis]EIM24395.1 hypothetical protein MicloDRAFT_00069140 [Microvirga lotononidis]WQO31320.1 hypothetical protein U0023_34090 [Microvirga lotononidis]